MAALELFACTARRNAKSLDVSPRWRGCAVIDKWFSPGESPQPDTLESTSLTAQVFSLAKPSTPLIGTLRKAMPPTNRADGAGYNFIADTVLASTENPQVSARLATASERGARLSRDVEPRQKPPLPA
jgi:hypothetical protein